MVTSGPSEQYRPLLLILHASQVFPPTAKPFASRSHIKGAQRTHKRATVLFTSYDLNMLTLRTKELQRVTEILESQVKSLALNLHRVPRTADTHMTTVSPLQSFSCSVPHGYPKSANYYTQIILSTLHLLSPGILPGNPSHQLPKTTTVCSPLGSDRDLLWDCTLSLVF